MLLRELTNIKDTILNAMSSGMAYADALLLAGASDEQIAELDNDNLFQVQCKQTAKDLEHQLLLTLKDTIEIQASKGKDHGVTWLLSKINPSRYGGGDDNAADNVGSIVINTQHVDLRDPESAVEIFDGNEQTEE